MTCGRSLPGEGLSLLGFFDMATAVSSIHTSRLPRLAGFGGQWPVLARGTPTPQGPRAFVEGLLTQATSATP